ncbi:hypothetical protein DSO57_1028797 [Entomophthora muscae]|uniref:Uncharacterized protein n=1 Tax=Entomophthora muscae TaxID=34485 RepID=A0ACC2RG02_9FUNG|nr:hypothetical protein DSO57_1028797 [Entomophthora muscae]
MELSKHKKTSISKITVTGLQTLGEGLFNIETPSSRSVDRKKVQPKRVDRLEAHNNNTFEERNFMEFEPNNIVLASDSEKKTTELRLDSEYPVSKKIRMELELVQDLKSWNSQLARVASKRGLEIGLLEKEVSRLAYLEIELKARIFKAKGSYEHEA